MAALCIIIPSQLIANVILNTLLTLSSVPCCNMIVVVSIAHWYHTYNKAGGVVLTKPGHSHLWCHQTVVTWQLWKGLQWEMNGMSVQISNNDFQKTWRVSQLINIYIHSTQSQMVWSRRWGTATLRESQTTTSSPRCWRWRGTTWGRPIRPPVSLLSWKHHHYAPSWPVVSRP